MMLANRFSGQRVAGWWLSEKLDGWRAFWDGSVLRTKDSWLPIPAPQSIIGRLPTGIALDGELWAGRGTLGFLSGLLQRKDINHPGWAAVRYMLFDTPTCGAIPFEVRRVVTARIAKETGSGLVEHRRCVDGADALHEMERVVAAGGEGCVLREPGHCYAFGRSRSWLKVKPAHVD